MRALIGRALLWFVEPALAERRRRCADWRAWVNAVAQRMRAG